MSRLAVFVAAVAIAAGATAQAAWRVGASVGYTVGGDVNDSDIAPGAHVTWVINDTWSLELGVAQFSDSAGEVEDGVRWGSDVDATPITLTATAGWPLGDRVRGYAGLGLGYTLIDASGTAEITTSDADRAAWEVDADNGYGAQVLAGIEVGLSDAVTAFADARLARLAYDYEGVWTTRYGDESFTGVESDTEDYTYGLVRIGLQVDL